MTFEQGLLIAVGALAGCVIVLFAWFRAQYASLEAKLASQATGHALQIAAMEAERKSLFDRLTVLERNAGWLGNCPIVTCPFHKSLSAPGVAQVPAQL